MNIALGIEYAGTDFCGWQRQSHSPSVQETLEKVLSEIANHSVEVFCAGRTDSGVHATGQVVHFNLQTERPLKAWHMGANTILPDSISVRWAKSVADNFHARHSATARRYRYVIQNTRYPSAHLNKKVTHFVPHLNEQLMHESAQSLLGEQDFSAFQAASCQSTTPFRHVDFVHVIRVNQFVVVDIQANAFLHHMVRNIVGSLLQVGCGKQDVGYMQKLLALKDRTQAAATAKPHGLYLVDVDYPIEYELPRHPIGPLTFADKLR